MAYYRQIYMTFWTDSKVSDEFTPEDKYFYLYLLTNSRTNLCGCYEISTKQIVIDTGYNSDTVQRLFERLENVHGVLKHCPKTKEVLLLNWHKYNWNTSQKQLKGVASECVRIKNPEFRRIVTGYLTEKGYPIDNEGYPISDEKYPMDTTVTVTVTDTVSVTDTVNDNNNPLNSSGLERVEGEVVDNISIQRHEIIDYLNEQTGKQFRADSAGNKKHIDGRLNEGYSVEDFKKVIDNKVYEWKGTEQEQYLRPETLFAPSHFESYLNQKKVRRKQASVRDDSFWATVGGEEDNTANNFLEDWG